MGRGKIGTLIDVALGVRIRILRVERGWSQKALGAHLGVSFQQMAKYEKGTNHLAPERLLQVAEFLNVSIAALLEEAASVRAAGHTPTELLLVARCTAARDLMAHAQRLWETNHIHDIVALAHIAKRLADAAGPSKERKTTPATLRLPSRAADRVIS